VTLISGPTNVQNFVAFTGSKQISIQSYTFTDTVSQKMLIDSSNPDACGKKIFTFSINSANTAFLSGNNT